MNYQLFKVLGKDGESIHGGWASWSLPQDGISGDWMPEVTPDICRSGYHLVADPLVWWQQQATLWLAEVDPKSKAQFDGSKGAFARVRLLEQVTMDSPLALVNARVRCFLAASNRDLLPWADLARANLARANLYGAYRPYNAPDGWTPDSDRRLIRNLN